MLLIVGLGTGALLMALLCVNATAQYGQLRQTDVQGVEMLPISLPSQVEDTGLLAVRLASYDGPFLEDGTGDEVVGVAALVIENTGGTMVSEGSVILVQGERMLVFELTGLPPGACALVLEKDRQSNSADAIQACWGWVRREYPENMGQVGVEHTGLGSLAFTNRTTEQIYKAEALFKNYDAVSGMYIGGISYLAEVAQLQAGETRVISPPYFAVGYSKVVRVAIEIE